MEDDAGDKTVWIEITRGGYPTDGEPPWYARRIGCQYEAHAKVLDGLYHLANKQDGEVGKDYGMVPQWCCRVLTSTSEFRHNPNDRPPLQLVE